MWCIYIIKVVVILTAQMSPIFPIVLHQMYVGVYRWNALECTLKFRMNAVHHILAQVRPLEYADFLKFFFPDVNASTCHCIAPQARSLLDLHLSAAGNLSAKELFGNLKCTCVCFWHCITCFLSFYIIIENDSALQMKNKGDKNRNYFN